MQSRYFQVQNNLKNKLDILKILFSCVNYLFWVSSKPVLWTILSAFNEHLWLLYIKAIRCILISFFLLYFLFFWNIYMDELFLLFHVFTYKFDSQAEGGCYNNLNSYFTFYLKFLQSIILSSLLCYHWCFMRISYLFIQVLYHRGLFWWNLN